MRGRGEKCRQKQTKWHQLVSSLNYGCKCQFFLTSLQDSREDTPLFMVLVNEKDSRNFFQRTLKLIRQTFQRRATPLLCHGWHFLAYLRSFCHILNNPQKPAHLPRCSFPRRRGKSFPKRKGNRAPDRRQVPDLNKAVPQKRFCAICWAFRELHRRRNFLSKDHVKSPWVSRIFWIFWAKELKP